MMMRYHFGLGVGHTYLHYEPSDSIGASNIEEFEDDNDGDNMDFHPPFNSSANPQPRSESDSGSEWSEELEELGDDDELEEDPYQSDDEEFLALNEMYGLY